MPGAKLAGCSIDTYLDGTDEFVKSRVARRLELRRDWKRL